MPNGIVYRCRWTDIGALTTDKNVLGDPDWNTVFNRHEKDAIVRRLQELNLPARSTVGMHLGSLTAVERQALAVYRSRNVDLIGWYEPSSDDRPHFARRGASMEVARSVVKLGYSTDRHDVQPVLAREPTDAEIYRHFLLRRE